MKIHKNRLAEIVREEVLAHVNSLLGEASVEDANDDKKDKEKKGKADPPAPQNDPDNSADKEKSKAPGDQPPAPGEPPVQPETGDDPADDDLEDEPDLDDVEDDEKKSLSDELEGKTVQSITQEPKSKVLPGAQEIVVTFNEVADSLRILITKSGQVKFLWRNALHNEV